MKRAILIAGVLGVAIPLLLFSTMQWTPYLDDLSEQTVLWMWPTYFFLLGFSGPVNSTVVLAVTIAAAVNGAIYALIALVVFLIARRIRGMPSHRQIEKDT